MDVLLQSLLLAAIGVCVWLAFRPVADELDTAELDEAPVPSAADSAASVDAPVPGRRREVVASEGRLVAQARPSHDDAPGAKSAGSEHDPV